MVAATKWTAAIAFALGCAACVTPVVEMKTNASSSAHDAEVLQLARERMLEAFIKLEQKIRDCDNNMRMTTVVSPTAIPKLPLSERDWGTALLHLSNRATARCQGDAWGDALLAYTRFRDLEKRTTGGNATNTSPWKYCAASVNSERSKPK